MSEEIDTIEKEVIGDSVNVENQKENKAIEGNEKISSDIKNNKNGEKTENTEKKQEKWIDEVNKKISETEEWKQLELLSKKEKQIQEKKQKSSKNLEENKKIEKKIIKKVSVLKDVPEIQEVRNLVDIYITTPDGRSYTITTGADKVEEIKKNIMSEYSNETKNYDQEMTDYIFDTITD